MALALAFTVPASAGPITLGTFHEFGFSTAGPPATGCDPADPAGPFCISSSGTPTDFLNAPPWTFVASAVGAVLTVTDAFTAGDRFQVFDFGTSLGLTSASVGSANCGDDPVPCLATPGISKGTFVLATGNHSISITPTLAPSGGGSGYLQVQAIPEPSAWTLSASAPALWFSRGDYGRVPPKEAGGEGSTGIFCLSLSALLSALPWSRPWRGCLNSLSPHNRRVFRERRPRSRWLSRRTMRSWSSRIPTITASPSSICAWIAIAAWRQCRYRSSRTGWLSCRTVPKHTQRIRSAERSRGSR